MIELKNITHRYKDGANTIEILVDFSLSIETGSFTVIVGPSGCGKTTLLNIMGGLLKPTSGEASICGESYYALSKDKQAEFRSKNIGYVFQDFYLIDDFSVIDNVLLSMNSVEASQKSKRETAMRLLSDLGLSRQIKQRIHNLSGGERQRIAIARAIANDRQIILCDEPTGSLDEKFADDIIQLLHALKEEGRTVIVVTHNMKYAENADTLVDFSEFKQLSMKRVE